MSITWLSSKRFTQKCVYIFTLYRTSVIVLKPPPLHPLIHSIIKRVQKSCFYKPREKPFLKWCVFRCFLKEERDGELRTFVRREFQILAAWKWKDLFPADLRLILGTYYIGCGFNTFLSSLHGALGLFMERKRKKKKTEKQQHAFFSTYWWDGLA